MDILSEVNKKKLDIYVQNQESEWGDFFGYNHRIMELASTWSIPTRLRLVRHFFYYEDGVLEFSQFHNHYYEELRNKKGFDALKRFVRDIGLPLHEGPLTTLEACTNLEQFKNKLDELIQFPKLRMYGRLFARQCEQLIVM